MEEWRYSSTIPDLGTRWSGKHHDPAALPAVPIGWEAGWDPEPVWTLWRKEKSLPPAGNQTPAVQLVAIPTKLNRFQFNLTTLFKI
jgi:hypothetical protein